MTDEQTVLTARELTEALQTLTAELQKANQYSRQSRRMIWVTIVSLLLDVALTIALSFVAVQAKNASHAAETARSSSTALCAAGNPARREQREIWLYFLHLVGHPKTQSAAHSVALLRAHIYADFAPRNCAALGNRK